MSDHFEAIYTQRAGDYHAMIAAEDYLGNLLPALERVSPLAGRRVLDLGTGSGRIPLLLHRMASVTGVDLHRAMLLENRAQRHGLYGSWDLVQADMRRLPLRAASADVVTAGWAIGHLCGWFPDSWPIQVGQVLGEMHRLARPGGALIVLETLGTGRLDPAPPSPALAGYYAWLEDEWGFERQEIRTDYHFESVESAVAHTEFFFGPELAAEIRRRAWRRLPEWTGVWGKRLD